MSLLPSMPAGKDMQEDNRACDACAPQSCLQDVGCPRAVPAPCVAENCLEESRAGAEDCVKSRMKHNIMLFCMLGVCQGSSLFRWGAGENICRAGSDGKHGQGQLCWVLRQPGCLPAHKTILHWGKSTPESPPTLGVHLRYKIFKFLTTFNCLLNSVNHCCQQNLFAWYLYLQSKSGLSGHETPGDLKNLYYFLLDLKLTLFSMKS